MREIIQKISSSSSRLSLKEKLALLNDWLMQRSEETNTPVGPIEIGTDTWAKGDTEALNAIRNQIKGIAQRTQIPPKLLP